MFCLNSISTITSELDEISLIIWSKESRNVSHVEVSTCDTKVFLCKLKGWCWKNPNFRRFTLLFQCNQDGRNILGKIILNLWYFTRAQKKKRILSFIQENISKMKFTNIQIMFLSQRKIIQETEKAICTGEKLMLHNFILKYVVFWDYRKWILAKIRKIKKCHNI